MRFCDCSLPDGHSWARDGWELDGARETLVPLGVVVLETNLQLDRLHEVSSLLAVSTGEELLNRAPHA